ncbi:hypothetical protein GOBAR_DD23678 [Gossypium barbadense]|nr:hypothetical protein GOBAR_DD23678 [Gossypium barbadense]
MEAQLANLTAMVSKLMTGSNSKASLCGICCLEGHAMNMCPTLQEGEVNVVFPNQRSSQPYNIPQQPQQNLNAETKTHAMFEQMMKMMSDQKKEADRKFQALESVVKQLQIRASGTDVNLGNLQAQVNNRLPSQPMTNSRDNVIAITLRSGKEFRPILKKVRCSDEEDETEVKKIRFSDTTEEISTMPGADIQQPRTIPMVAEKSHLQ